MAITPFRTILAATAAILALFTGGCKYPVNVATILANDPGQRFVDHKYLSDRPIAQLINMPNNSDLQESFEIDKDTNIEIYGVGELIYNLADVEPRYFFKGDDIELFFKSDSIARQFIFPWSDSKGKGENKVINIGKDVELKAILYQDSVNNKYYTEIRLPWKAVGVLTPKPGTQFGVEVVIGDCDDHFKQKGKIAWYNTSKDPLYQKNRVYGRVLLQGNSDINPPAASGELLSMQAVPNPNFRIAAPWQNFPVSEIEHTVAGSVKDKYDLSAKLRSCWTKDSLYFFVEVQDGNFDRIKKQEISNQQTFLDYGWIENEKHEKIWIMHAMNSKWAGGAVKNQQTDQVLHLKAGKYVLHYVTDESHTYNDWDDDGPLTPFYGVVIYQKK